MRSSARWTCVRCMSGLGHSSGECSARSGSVSSWPSRSCHVPAPAYANDPTPTPTPPIASPSPTASPPPASPSASTLGAEPGAIAWRARRRHPALAAPSHRHGSASRARRRAERRHAAPSAARRSDAVPEELEAARARDAELLASAKSLTQIIDAQALVARDELAALNAEIARVGKELEDVGTDIAALQAQANDRRAIRDRLARDAFRLAAATSTPSTERAEQRADRGVPGARLSIDASLHEAHARLTDRAAQLAARQESVAAKQGQLSRLRDRGANDRRRGRERRGRASARPRSPSSKRSRATPPRRTPRSRSSSRTAMAADGAAPSAWSLPVRGTITQPFGPTTFALEPARTYQGVVVRALPRRRRLRGAPGPARRRSRGGPRHVRRPSLRRRDGRVIAHSGGLVSVYAHLDDTFARPPVQYRRQRSAAGQVDRLRRTHRHHDRPASALRRLARRPADRSALAARLAVGRVRAT